MEAWGAEVSRSEEGSALVDSVFAILFLLTLMLGAIQIVFTLYSRNVVRAAAHEGVRSAIERGATGAAAIAAARKATARAAGGLVDELEVEVQRRDSGQASLVMVNVRGRLAPVGPFPFRMPVTATAQGIFSSDPP